MAMTPSRKIGSTKSQPPNSVKEKTFALVRIVLGTGQIVGATVSLVLLLRTGINGPSVSVTVFTGLLTLTSKLLFRGQK